MHPGLELDLALLHPSAGRVRVGGELDVATAPALLDAMEVEVEHIAGAAIEDIELDLRGVSFCDVAGMRGIIAARRCGARHGIRVRLRPSAPVARVADLLGVEPMPGCSSGRPIP